MKRAVVIGINGMTVCMCVRAQMCVGKLGECKKLKALGIGSLPFYRRVIPSNIINLNAQTQRAIHTHIYKHTHNTQGTDQAVDKTLWQEEEEGNKHSV